MTDMSGSAPSLLARLQLSVGPTAKLGDERARSHDRIVVDATARATGDPLIVTLFSAPPLGPDAAVLLDRFGRLRKLEHPSLELPVAQGELDDCAWIVEPAPAVPSVADRLPIGAIPLTQGVSAIRDLARALAALHRREIFHGAIELDVVRLDANGTRLGGFGLSLGASPRDDLDALGRVAWSLLSGERHPGAVRRLSRLRRGVSPRLDIFAASLLATNPADRPQSAEAVLDALDAIPTPRRNPLTSIVDPGWHDGRPRVYHSFGWLLVCAAIVILVALLSSRA